MDYTRAPNNTASNPGKHLHPLLATGDPRYLYYVVLQTLLCVNLATKISPFSCFGIFARDCRHEVSMASQADYKDRQFLAVIGDEVASGNPSMH